MVRNKYKVFRNKIFKKTLEFAFLSQSSHIGSNLSIIDILSVLFLDHINKNSQNKFILSKGHACLSYYIALSLRGYFDLKNLHNYGKENTVFLNHSHHKVPGVLFSTGSLGHGLPHALGLAIAQKKKKIRGKIFVLLSDGELNEGSNWEALSLISKLKIDNLYILVDGNGIQSIDFTKDVTDYRNIKQIIKNFNLDYLSADGHNHIDIKRVLNNNSNKTKFIFFNTIKGYGVDFMENTIDWHYKSLSAEQLKHSLKFKLK